MRGSSEAYLSSAHLVDARARRLFQASFGYLPAAVITAPGRMNLLGEHTDYNEGFVLPAAIDRHAGVALSPRRDTAIRLVSDRYQGEARFPALPAVRRGDWTDHALGVMVEVRRRTGEASGCDVAIASDIPTGAGLSSSGALEVALALAIASMRGLHMPTIELARLCQQAENRFVGVRTGIMDQLTALSARAKNALLIDCRSLKSEHLPLPDARFSWLLADTRVKHELAASAYNRRRSECESAARRLGIASLRDAGERDLARLADPVLLARARHVLTENARVLAAAQALRRREATALGPLLRASHASLRDDFSVSCSELDTLAAAADEHPGVLGARMMGGGFGGCVLVLAEAAALPDIEAHLLQAYSERFHRAPEYYRVRSADGALAGRA